MIAASALVVAVLASYAGIGMLSLSATAPFKALSTLPGVDAVVSGIGFQKPTVDSVTKFAKSSGASAVNVVADVTGIDIGPVSTSSTLKPTVSIRNTSKSPIKYHVQVNGADAHGVTASFANGATQRVYPSQSATVYLATHAQYAGVVSGTLEVSAAGLKPTDIPIRGELAPLAPGALTATPAKGGAVDLSWDASGSVSGVGGYIVQRSTDGTTWSQVANLPNATTFVDQTPSDSQYSYRVVTVENGPQALQSTPGPIAVATSDSTPPTPPKSVSGPTWINSATDASVPVAVQLASDFQPSDQITVTLTGPGGGTVSQTVPAGTGSFSVNLNAQSLGDGNITASATAADSLGNAGQPALSVPNSITKDTVAPADPAPPSNLDTITNQNQQSYSFQVEAATAWSATSTVHAQFTDANGLVVAGSGSASDGIVDMKDLTSLADGPIQVSVWATDAAGNASDRVSGTVTKQATPPAAPTDFGIAAGPDNPAGVVTPKSVHDVYITATFAQAPAQGDEIKIFANHQTIVDQQGDGQTTSFTFGPFDFSGIDPGAHRLGMMQTDAVGNETWVTQPYTVDGGAQGPDSVTVPAGPSNPAGYVNAATQAAATIVATFAAPTDPADQIALSVGGLSLGTQSGGDSSISWTGDLSSLPDGTLQILGTITDPNGVQTTFTGSLIKDTTPPPAPAVAGVVGPPPNVITPGHDSCVNVGVAFNQAPDPADTVTVTLSDGSNSVQGSAPAGAGQVTVGCIDASSLAAGPVSVTVTVTDLAGNSVTFTGTPATKVACQNQGQ